MMMFRKAPTVTATDPKLLREAAEIQHAMDKVARRVAKISFIRGWLLAKGLTVTDSLSGIACKNYQEIEQLAEKHCQDLKL